MRSTSQAKTKCQILFPAVLLPALLLAGHAAPAQTGSPRPELPPAPPASPLSRVAVLGDSASAGFQNGSLLDAQQPNGWASLLAQQAGFRLQLPLVGAPGFPGVYSLVEPGLPPVLKQAPGATQGRENPRVLPDDLAVPGAFVKDLLQTRPVGNPANGQERMTALVLGSGGTQVEQALALKPTAILLWIGNNDALKADGMGDPAEMTPPAEFAAELAELIQALHTGAPAAHLVVADIPDVTELPYMTPASKVLGEMAAYTHIPSFFFSAAFGIQPGDLLNWQGLGDLKTGWEGLIAGRYPTPLPPSEVLTPSEIAAARATIDSYNQTIAAQVAAVGGVLVDLHGYVDTLAASGVTLNGRTASTAYLGGLFGLDGIHPTNTGYALFANQFIQALNAQLGTEIPAVDVQTIAARDPYFIRQP